MRKQITFEEIKEIIDLVRQTDNVSDFTLKCGDVEISLSRGGPKRAARAEAPVEHRAPAKSESVMPLETAPVAAETHVEAETEPGEGEVVVKSPMVGTFYRSPKPGEPPFVEVGQAVREDTVLCIIEVMKLMNSIEAKVRGTVARILVEDAQPVEHGQPLMIIKVDEG
jgi:acetyl-CoA carboxylase biotin carboxyl carrier protein